MTLEEINAELDNQQKKLDIIKENIIMLKRARLMYLPPHEAFMLAYKACDLKLLDYLPTCLEYPNTRKLIDEWDYNDGERVNILATFEDDFVFLTDPEYYSKYVRFRKSPSREEFLHKVVAEMIEGGFYGFVNTRLSELN